MQGTTSTRNMVTRTLSTTTCTIHVFDADVREMTTEFFSANGELDEKQLVKLYNKVNKGGAKLAHYATEIETSSCKYGLSYEDFIKYATIID